MLLETSAINKFALEANDGTFGTVTDLLLNDQTWRVRWLVIEIGAWLTDRKVLVHPSAIRQVDAEGERFGVALSMAQVKASPDISKDQPVSRYMESRLYGYYGWDPYWRDNYFESGSMAMPSSPPPMMGVSPTELGGVAGQDSTDVDPFLRSAAEIVGYHIHASDGEIGRLENLQVGTLNWNIQHIITNTKNWWPGRHVRLSPHAVRAIEWSDRAIQLDLTRDQVRKSPQWTSAAKLEEAYGCGAIRPNDWSGSGL